MEHTQEKSIDVQIVMEATKQLKIKYDTLNLLIKATVIVIVVVVALCYGYNVRLSTEWFKIHLQKGSL